MNAGAVLSSENCTPATLAEETRGHSAPQGSRLGREPLSCAGVGAIWGLIWGVCFYS